MSMKETEAEEGADARARAAESVPLPEHGIHLERLERALLLKALERSRWHQRRAGELLGLNRDQVRYRISKYGIAPPPGRLRRVAVAPSTPEHHRRAIGDE